MEETKETVEVYVKYYVMEDQWDRSTPLSELPHNYQIVEVEEVNEHNLALAVSKSEETRPEKWWEVEIENYTIQNKNK